MIMDDKINLIGRKEAASLLGVSGQALDRYRIAGLIKARQYVPTSPYLYDKAEIIALRDSNLK